MKTQALNLDLARLEELLAHSPTPAGRFPGLWIRPDGPAAIQTLVPEQFFRDRLRAILSAPRRKRVTDGDVPGDWGKHAISYNLLVRYGAAFDPDGDPDNPTRWLATVVRMDGRRIDLLELTSLGTRENGNG